MGATCSGAKRYPWLGPLQKHPLDPQGSQQLLTAAVTVKTNILSWKMHINHHQQQEMWWDSLTHLCYLHRQPHLSAYRERAAAARTTVPGAITPWGTDRGPGGGERGVFRMLLERGEWRLFYSRLLLPSCCWVTTAFASNCKIIM